MPWTVNDVDRHKKGLTPAQKKKWVSIANGVLESCKKAGGSDCEGKAIRIANSKFSSEGGFNMDNKIPKGALRFVAPQQTACAFASDEGKDKLQMTVYSGGVMANHWYWDNLILDLKGIKFGQKVFPILEDHDTSRKIGFHKKPNVGDDIGIQLDPETSGFVETPESEEFRRLSKSGFPYQSSLYGRPIKVQRFGADEEVIVNGRKVKGPGTVWKEWEFKESSVCVFGWDSRTKASAFSREETEEVDYEVDGFIPSEESFNDKLKGGETIMDRKELQEKYPTVFAEVIEEGKKAGKEEVEKTFSEERKSYQTQIDSLSSKLGDQSDRIAKMEKELTLSREKELENEADKIFSDLYADSDLDDRLEPKVRNQVNHRKFVKDEKLDKEAFSEAVKAEIADWEDRLSESGVRGIATSSDEDDEEEGKGKKFGEENKGITNDLLSRVGQKPKE